MRARRISRERKTKSRLVQLRIENEQRPNFGLGLDRLVMMCYAINDIRYIHSGNLRFLKQFVQGVVSLPDKKDWNIALIFCQTACDLGKLFSRSFLFFLILFPTEELSQFPERFQLIFVKDRLKISNYLVYAFPLNIFLQ